MPKNDKAKKCERCGGAGLEPNDNKTGAKFRALREQAGLTIRQMAEKMPITAGHLCALENGNRHWRPVTIESFQRALKTLTKA